MFFSPRGGAPRRFFFLSFYLHEATRGFISPRLYRFGAAAKPAKHLAGFFHPDPLLPHRRHHLYRLACEDLLPRWWRGSM